MVGGLINTVILSGTGDDRYTMPRPEELLDRVGQVKFISTLDMTKGYYQVPMSVKD